VAKYVVGARAEQDLKDIWRRIAPDNERAADDLLIRILDKIELAAGQPLIGSPRPEFSPTARILIEGRYVVIYEPVDYGIFVVAVVHGARDISNWLG
jgi:plasmid stabilization system protein ParE